MENILFIIEMRVLSSLSREHPYESYYYSNSKFRALVRKQKADIIEISITIITIIIKK